MAFLFVAHVSAQTEPGEVCEDNSCCCADDPTPAGVMISHVHKKKEWMLSYRYMNMGMKGLISGTSNTDKNIVFVNYLMAPDKMRMDMHMLMGMYGITNRLTVMAMFHYNTLSMNMSMFDTGVHNHPGMTSGSNGAHTMKTTGLGDTKIHLMYAFIKKTNHQLIISGGVSIPTGSIEKKGGGDEMMYANQRLPYSMQLGSGTTDVLPGISYLYQRSALTFSTQVTSVIRVGANSSGYSLGNEATSNTWIAYQWKKYLSTSLRFESSVAEKINGYDPTLYLYSEPSANPYNYGGKRRMCFTGVVIQPKSGMLKKQRLGIEYGVPVYQNLNGIQMKSKQSVNASWAMLF